VQAAQGKPLTPQKTMPAFLKKISTRFAPSGAPYAEAVLF
jgi:hypothetical protein